MNNLLLAERTWRDLRATFRAHNLRFNNNFTKTEAAQALTFALLNDGLLKRAINRLTDSEHEALMALRANGGRLQRRRFCAIYGQIPRYRPWLPDALPHPWRYPRSTAEKLWFLGLIEVDEHRAVLLPDAVSALLPPVPHPQSAVWDGLSPALDPAAVVRDLAGLLGTLLHSPVRPLHGCWLPPYALKNINQRLSQPEDLTGIRSEFQTQRIRFLHYLVLVSTLVSVENGRLLPTPEAWRWLALSYNEAHHFLIEAVSADLRTRQPLWDRFKLPAVGSGIWEALLVLPPGTYTVGSLSDNLRYHLAEPHAVTKIRAALLGLLRWLGIGTLEESHVFISDLKWPDDTSAQLSLAPDSLGITLPAAPPLHALTQILSFATIDERGLRLDEASMYHAAEARLSAQHIAQILVELVDSPLPRAVLDQLSAWEKLACRVKLRHVSVLTAASPDEMHTIRSDWRLRPFLGTQLSPHHIEVRDERALRQSLARRGYPLPFLNDQADPLPRANDDNPAYLWLAARICQSLAGIIPLPIPIPGAAAASLETQLGDQIHTLQSMVDQTVERVRAALRGVTNGRPLIEAPDSSRIHAALEHALAIGNSLRIRYFSPNANKESERVIEPQVIYDYGGATYIEAWCYLDDAQRTFRLDRVLAVL